MFTSVVNVKLVLLVKKKETNMRGIVMQEFEELDKMTMEFVKKLKELKGRWSVKSAEGVSVKMLIIDLIGLKNRCADFVSMAECTVILIH